MIADRGLRIAERKGDSLHLADAVMSADDFRKRTFQRGIRIVHLVEALPKTDAARVIAKQLLRSGTAVGANYRAVARARSRADFIAKMGVVEEECDESLYWFDLLIQLQLVSETRLKALRGEPNEILSIVVASIRTARVHGKHRVR
jgi:four helix bundle protein